MSIKRVTVELDHGRIVDISPWVGVETNPESVILLRIYPKEWEILTKLLAVLRENQGACLDQRRVNDESGRQTTGDEGPTAPGAGVDGARA